MPISRIRLAVASAVTAGTIAMAASAASAHVSFDKTSVPASSTQAVQARVPVEDFGDPTTFNDGVRVRLPQSFSAVSCATPVGWTCVVEDRATGDHIIWSRDAGTGPIDLLDFTIDTPAQVGRYAVPVDQSKSNGELVSWENGEGEDHPAPILEVTPAGTAPASNDEGGGSHDGSDDSAIAPADPAAATSPSTPSAQSAPDARQPTPTTNPSPAASATPATATDSPTDADPVATGDEEAAPLQAAIVAAPVDSGGSSSTPAVIVALLALSAAIAGTFFWRRNRAGRPDTAGDHTSV